MKGEIYGKPSPPIPSISVKFHKCYQGIFILIFQSSQKVSPKLLRGFIPALIAGLKWVS